MSSVKALKNITNVSDNSVTYHDVYTDTDLTYVVANSAVKEYITLNSKNAPTAFAFTFKLNGLTAEAVEGGTVAFKDGDKTVFELGSLFAVDAKEAYTDELEYTIIKNTGDVAIIGVALSEEYAKSPDRAYPIVIDPTVMVTGASNTYDTFICSTYPDNSYYLNTYLRTGRNSTYGICRTYIKFNIPSTITSSCTITSANIALEKYSGSTPNIRACRVVSNWSSSSLTWTEMASFTSATSSGLATNYSGNWYRMYITSMVQAWHSGTYPNYGVVIKDDTETSTSQWTAFYSSDSVSPHRPELNITYSESGGTGGGTGTSTGGRISSLYGDVTPYASFIQNRTNCYAYALHMYRCTYTGTYNQQVPGEFADDEITYETLTTTHGIQAKQAITPEDYADYIEEKMVEDFAGLGGSSNSEWVFDEAWYGKEIAPGRRRIAFVVKRSCKPDETYEQGSWAGHFYMRHDNGIWSYKDLNGAVTNIAIGTETDVLDDNGQTLDKETFENLLQNGGYHEIDVRYYDIGKSAVIDYPHTTSSSDSLQTEILETADKAGVVRAKSIDFGKPTTSGNIDYSGDIDWFKITCTPGTYVLTSTADTGLDIDLDFCNSAGTVLTEEHNTGAVGGYRILHKSICKR